jgi:hypothetical protein
MVSASAERRHASSEPDRQMPPSTTSRSRLRRSRAAMARVHAPYTTGITSTGTTNTVRRIPSTRTTVRSSNRARSTSATPTSPIRAHDAR